MEATKESRELLRVKIQTNDKAVLLGDLKELSYHLQQTLNAVARNLARTDNPNISYEIVEAAMGSLNFALRAVAAKETELDPDESFDVFTSDLENIRLNNYRPAITATLIGYYRSLVRTLSKENAIVQYQYANKIVQIDGNFRESFNVVLKESIAEDITVSGNLDEVNAHKSQFSFNLYPKLGGERIMCLFPNEMLSTIADMLKRKSVVQATGKGHFAPVGLYPTRLEVLSLPKELPFHPDRLRSYVHAFDLFGPDITAEEYLQRNREAAGIAD